MEKLVSIITPCYNGSNYITRLLDSVLVQTFPNIEMILIDDGSTDNSEEIVKSFIPKFELKGYKLIYLYQENLGQSVALNTGLKLFNGDYLTWPDSDDFYATDNAIEKMAQVLETSDNSVSMVRCHNNYLDEKTLELIRNTRTDYYDKDKVDLFEDCLYTSKEFWFGAGNYMVKSEKIHECIPDKEIYTAKNAGQNWQILLPLLYKNKCLTINSQMYNILLRSDSHSRGGSHNFDLLSQREKTYEDTVVNTLERMILLKDNEKSNYLEEINKIYLYKKLILASRFGKAKLYRRIYSELKTKHSELISIREKILFLASLIPFGTRLVIISEKVFNYKTGN